MMKKIYLLRKKRMEAREVIHREKVANGVLEQDRSGRKIITILDNER